MQDRELQYVQEYHRRLIENAHMERQLKSLRSARPTWSDHLLLQLGDSLIALGERLKDGRPCPQTNDLSQECA